MLYSIDSAHRHATLHKNTEYIAKILSLPFPFQYYEFETARPREQPIISLGLMSSILINIPPCQIELKVDLWNSRIDVNWKALNTTFDEVNFNLLHDISHHGKYADTFIWCLGCLLGVYYDFNKPAHKVSLVTLKDVI